MTTIFDVRRASYADGPGLRTTVFVKGYNLGCAWCHNPESRSESVQRMWYETKCVRCGKCAEKCPVGAVRFEKESGRLAVDREKCTLCGTCALYCPRDAIAICGREADADELFGEIARDKAYYGKEGGVTVSGGECLLHPEFTAALLARCKAEGIGTAVDTAGNVPWSAFEAVLPYTDLFLYDIKCMTPELHRRFVGADNGRILENYLRLSETGANVVVRVPVIPGFNDGDGEFGKIAAFLGGYPPRSVELLPYHALGEHKYRALGSEPVRFAVPSEKRMNELKAMLSSKQYAKNQGEKQ